MTSIKAIWTLNIFIISILLSACIGSSSSIPNDKFYRLPDTSVQKLPEQVLNGLLTIKHFRTNGIYSERALIYSNYGKPLQLQRYHYHYWEKSPSLLLQNNLIQYFNAIGFAYKTTQYDSQASSNYILTGEIIRLQREILSNQTYANVAIKFQLTDKNNNILLIKQYNQSVPANSNKIYDTIIAYSRALTTIYSELIVDIKQLQEY